MINIQTPDNLPLEGLPTWGAECVVNWSSRVHGKGSRHRWAMIVARELDAGTSPSLLTPFPDGASATKRSRMETVLRIYKEANGDL